MPDRENHEEIDGSAFAALAAADRIAEVENLMPVFPPEMGGSEVGRSAIAAASDHRALNPKTLLGGRDE
jgi:hypothetical protein